MNRKPWTYRNVEVTHNGASWEAETPRERLIAPTKAAMRTAIVKSLTPRRSNSKKEQA